MAGTGLAWLPTLLLAGCSGGPLCGEGPLDADTRSCVFETAWSAAAADYPFFALKDIDWDAVHDAYLDQLDGAESDAEFYALIQRMIAELQDGHSRFDYSGASWGESVTSIEFAEIDGRYWVARVLEGSTAWELGIRPGAELLRVDGEGVQERWDRARAQISGANERWRQYLFMAAYLSAGEAENAELELELPPPSGGDPVVLSVPRGEPVPATPPVEGWLVDERYGYIRVHGFSDDAVGAFDDLVDRYIDAPGLIVDIRGNEGGSTTVMYDIAGRLYDEPVEVFRWHKRRTKIRSFKPRGKTIYVGPVVLLIDEAVYSTANAFAEGLAFTGRATLVGRPSSGGTGVPEYDELLTPDARLRLSTHYHDLVDGTQTEVSGVAPDREVEWTPQLLAEGGAQLPGDPSGDADLLEAIAILDDTDPGDTSAPGCGCTTADGGAPARGGGAGLLALALSVPAARTRRRRRDRRRAATAARAHRGPGPVAASP